MHHLQVFNRLPCNVNVIVILLTDQALAGVVTEPIVTTISGEKHELIWSCANESRKVTRGMALGIYQIQRTIVEIIDGAWKWARWADFHFGAGKIQVVHFLPLRELLEGTLGILGIRRGHKLGSITPQDQLSG
jgi:hypothetical protein